MQLPSAYPMTFTSAIDVFGASVAGRDDKQFALYNDREGRMTIITKGKDQKYRVQMFKKANLRSHGEMRAFALKMFASIDRADSTPIARAVREAAKNIQAA